MKYTYTQAPLPFQGQKRRFLKPFKEVLNQFSATATYVDLFGGSGLLSHTVKQHYPNAKVIYNDFDGYSYRLENIPKTNALLDDIRRICPKISNKKEKINNEIKSKIISRIENEKGFIDYITLSASLLFSMNYSTSMEELKKETFYNKIRTSYYVDEGYLEGVERVQKDYRDLFAQYCNNKNVVLIVDPPYLSTDVSTFKNENYWKLSDYLNVLNVLKNKSYIYFTSNKSQLIELSEWIKKNGWINSPFNDSKKIIINAQLNKISKYQDIMIYRV